MRARKSVRLRGDSSRSVRESGHAEIHRAGGVIQRHIPHYAPAAYHTNTAQGDSRMRAEGK
jgi:hypothetical protein